MQTVLIDLKHILTNYSLEIKASINLKELVPTDDDRQVQSKGKKKTAKSKEVEDEISLADDISEEEANPTSLPPTESISNPGDD